MSFGMLCQHSEVRVKSVVLYGLHKIAFTTLGARSPALGRVASRGCSSLYSKSYASAGATGVTALGVVLSASFISKPDTRLRLTSCMNVMAIQIATLGVRLPTLCRGVSRPGVALPASYCVVDGWVRLHNVGSLFGQVMLGSDRLV